MRIALIMTSLLAAGLASFAPQEPSGKPVNPTARQESFLAGLKAGEIEKAYEGLVKGSRIEGKKDQVDNLMEQTSKGIKLYGGVIGWENVGIVRQEKYQSLGIGLLLCEQVPVYFYFIWYRNAESAPWTLVNVWFSDQVKDYWLLRR